MILKVVWRCATGDTGGQCVMITGISEMQVLPADSSILPLIVSD